jgi:hypothetical protein
MSAVEDTGGIGNPLRVDFFSQSDIEIGITNSSIEISHGPAWENSEVVIPVRWLLHRQKWRPRDFD